MKIENNILKHYLKNVYFITGTAYAGKSTTLFQMIQSKVFISDCRIFFGAIGTFTQTIGYKFEMGQEI